MQLFGVTPQDAIPLISALIGAIVGGLATFASTYCIQQINERNKKTRLRRAFVSELRLTSIDVADWHATEISTHLRSAFRDETNDELDSERLTTQMRRLESASNTNLRNDVYTENLSQIGVFDIDQVEVLLRYYHTLNICRSDVQEMLLSMEEDTLDGGDAEGLKHNLSQLKTEKDRLLEELNASEFNDEVGYASRRRHLEEERNEE